MSWDLISLALEGIWWTSIGVFMLACLAGALWANRPWRAASERHRDERWRREFERQVRQSVEAEQMAQVEANGPVWRPDPERLRELTRNLQAQRRG